MIWAKTLVLLFSFLKQFLKKNHVIPKMLTGEELFYQSLGELNTSNIFPLMRTYKQMILYNIDRAFSELSVDSTSRAFWAMD